MGKEIVDALTNLAGNPEDVSLDSIRTVARFLNSTRKNNFVIREINKKCHPLTIRGLQPHLSKKAKYLLKR